MKMNLKIEEKNYNYLLTIKINHYYSSWYRYLKLKNGKYLKFRFDSYYVNQSIRKGLVFNMNRRFQMIFYNKKDLIIFINILKKLKNDGIISTNRGINRSQVVNSTQLLNKMFKSKWTISDFHI